MRLSDFDFELPEHLIAQVPTGTRDASRLLIVPEGDAPFVHRHFPALVEALEPGDLLVVNDARVVPARLLGQKTQTGGRVELLLIRPNDETAMATALAAPPDAHRWRALGQASKGLKPGTALTFPAGLTAQVLGRLGEGEVEVAFAAPQASLGEVLAEVGRLPLPPYITRAPEAMDAERYQTVYGRAAGAIAAPTAGLHFTPELLQSLEAKGIRRAAVTLEVGPGTFMPVRTEDLDQHRMHAERFEIPEATVAAIEETRRRNGRVVAVGTTVVRSLESATDGSGRLVPGRNESTLFLRPGARLRQVDALVTNFHLPKSTLFMLICALLGMERARAAYGEAIAHGYRFFSYGDAMFIPRIPR
ncbi:MAG TPA: tRNA preQ1(34) S-adenosylmethionine ribosyltransferase-isomerase QueA [Myxococcaceae bacterium]|nr:tRNA preQ1(34) S-adenosylmethionine ribosyltransferase-isomerase QueA [Myxococcaceae bacterium]